jgi:hypothetical protein
LLRFLYPIKKTLAKNKEKGLLASSEDCDYQVAPCIIHFIMNQQALQDDPKWMARDL